MKKSSITLTLICSFLIAFMGVSITGLYASETAQNNQIEISTTWNQHSPWWNSLSVNIKNIGTSSVDGWTLKLYSKHQLATPGGAVIESHTGDQYTFANQSWGGSKIIQPGQTLKLTSGFSCSGTAPDKNTAISDINFIPQFGEVQQQPESVQTEQLPTTGTTVTETTQDVSSEVTTPAPIIPAYIPKENFKKINATYWCAWGGNTSYNINGKTIKSKAVPMDEINPNYNVIITAFIVTDPETGNYQLALGDPGSNTPTAYSKNQIINFIKKTEAQGRKVIVSLGGQYFHMEMKNQTDVNHFVEQVEKIVNEYGFEGIDIDLEGETTRTANPLLLGEAVTKVVNNYRDKGIDFWLTAAPEWCYVIPYTYGSGQYASHNLANDFYKKLINSIGMNNFTYIWPQTYNQGSANGVTGLNGIRVVPGDGMNNFLTAIAWGMSTTGGFKANGSNGVFVPGDKLCLGIAATEGAAGGGMLYIATPELIKNTWKLMEDHGVNISGFMNWSVDWDAINIPCGALSSEYSHTAWGTGETVGNMLNIQDQVKFVNDDTIIPSVETESTVQEGGTANLSTTPHYLDKTQSYRHFNTGLLKLKL